MAAFDKKTEIIWIGASQATLLAVNFLLLKLMTSRLSVESFGYYSLCMTIILFSRQVLYDPMSIVVAKNCGSAVHHPGEGGFETVRFVTDRLGVALFILGLFSALLAYGVFDSSTDGVIAWSCLAYLCANGGQGIYLNVLNSISDRKSAALFSILDSVLKLILVFFAFRYFGNEVVYTLISVSAGAFAVFLGVRWYVRTAYFSGGLPRANLKLIVKHSIIASVPLYLPALLGALRSVGDRWILAAFIGVDELAVFSVLLQLGYFPMLLLVGVVQTFVAPKVYVMCAVKSGAGRGELKVFLLKILSGIFVFACVACAIAIVVADWIFQLFVGKDYAVFSMYLPVFIVSGAFASAGGVLHLAVIGVFETPVVGKLMGVSVLISIVSASLLIVTLGLAGAVAGLVIASAVSALLYWLALYISTFRFVQDNL